MASDDDYRDLFGHPGHPYGGRAPSVRHSETSRAAAESIRKRIGPLHMEIIGFLTCNPRGATDEEMQTQIPMPANTQRPRRRELEIIGRVMDSARRRLTRSKRLAVVWVLREHFTP